MEKLKMLSGQELIDKGRTKLETVLPQTSSIKNITPNGSWLEQKQIQTALAERKCLVEAQRIEKEGVLNRAKWIEELQLAEVTEQCGGHWQFFGHSKDKKVYLKPEEALFLMEVNCLCLTYDKIVVSLQQAYTLLLGDKMPLYKYRVYASLSRLGYKVYQHVYSDLKENNDESMQNISGKEILVDNNCENSEDCQISNTKLSKTEMNHDIECDIESKNNEESALSNKNDANDNLEKINIDGAEILQNIEHQEDNSVDVLELHPNEADFQSDIIENSDAKSIHVTPMNITQCNQSILCEKDPITKFSESKLNKLKSKRNAGIKFDPHKGFENIPDLLENEIITINVPKEKYIPKNIFLNNLSYVINVEKVSSKNVTPQETDNRTYSMSDEANGDHIRRITSSTTVYRSQSTGIPHFYQNVRQNISYRQFTHWRPRPTLNYFQFNLFFQRHFIPNFNVPRFQFYPRTHLSMFPRYFTSTSICNERRQLPSPRREDITIRKRKRSISKKYHLESIKKLASRLRLLISVDTSHSRNVEQIQKLIDTYNLRYSSRLRLSDELEVISDEKIIETIDLDEDDECNSKKRRIDNTKNVQEVHLNRIRELSKVLKELESKRKASARHRRAFSSLIKTYNRSYNADIYVNDKYDILDKRSITLDSSSDSDCIPQEIPKFKSGKKLRNPFNILKRLSEKNISNFPTTSKQDDKNNVINNSAQVESTGLEQIFGEHWLPNSSDFGKPEIVSKDTMNIRIADSQKEDFLYDFMKAKQNKFHNWIDAKIAFFENIEEANAIIRTEAMRTDNVEIKSIIKSEDCTDLSNVLKKLSIIKTNCSCTETSLAVDFDVYNRDVQNFRKGNRPTPHFRIVCLEHSVHCPTGAEIATLHSKYKDDVMIIFAIVGIASISFLQILPTDSKVFPSCNDVG